MSWLVVAMSQCYAGGMMVYFSELVSVKFYLGGKDLEVLRILFKCM